VWMSVTASRRTRFAAVVLSAGLLLAACGGDDEPVASPSPSPSPSPTEEPPPPPAPEPVDPLTGLAPAPGTPLVAVKVDNAPMARPYHRGLEGAAVLYVELVEGGATRFLALYSQPFGAEMGPIRSFRESDIELLVQFGRPAVGFSGANDGVLRAFRAAVQAGQLANAGYDDHKGLYRIGERRRDAKNFFAVPDRLAAAEGAQPAKDVGWTFDDAPRPDAVPAGGGRVVFSDRAAVELRYDPATLRYSLVQDGQPLIGFAAANVVVQQVGVRGSGYRDVTGAVTPYTETVGAGTVDVLRDGVRTTGQWQRPEPAAGTRFVDPAGVDIALKPGPTLVLLQPAGLPLALG
jgi:hypothetical protein